MVEVASEQLHSRPVGGNILMVVAFSIKQHIYSNKQLFGASNPLPPTTNSHVFQVSVCYEVSLATLAAKPL